MIALIVWLGILGWSAYEVVLTRELRADNSWSLPDGAVVVLATLLLSALAFHAWRMAARARLSAGFAVLVVGAMTVGLVTWVVHAPLPEQQVVPLPPLNAKPMVVVRSFVAAVDEHDQATAQALYPRNYSADLDYYIRVRTTHIGPEWPDPYEQYSPGRDSLDVRVALAGWTRDGGAVGEDGLWTFVLVPIGPHHAWRIFDEGMP